MSQLIEHVQHFADVIGPRPATTDAEAQAADYIEDVFRGRGLEIERQEFECPRTRAWAFALYAVITIGSAVLSRWLGWPAFVLGIASAVLFWLELDARSGLSALLPKGPSQNVIARHIPKTRRNERLRRVVIVAHYDTAKPSLASGPGAAKSYHLGVALTKWTTFLTPAAIFVSALPWTRGWQPWSWYVTLALSAWLVVPLVVKVHQELFMKALGGANDNASGVAAMFGAMELTVPEQEIEPSRYSAEPSVRRSVEAAQEADVVLEDSLLSYTPVAPAEDEYRRPVADALDDIGWDGDEPARPARGQVEFDLGDADWELISDKKTVTAPEPAEPAAEESSPVTTAAAREEKRGLRDWLGVGKSFEVRREGKRIGNWDNLDEGDDDDNGFGLKGGTAGETAAFDAPDFAAGEAARIRRRVTTGVDRALTEKEVWFVATGAGEVGGRGMQAFLKEYGEDLRGATIINLDSLGTGSLHWITSEGMARRYHCDRRLASSAKRVARDEELPVRGRDYRNSITDATVALAHGFKAMSIMAFDINGRIPNRHWHTDTVEAVQADNIDLAADFVTKLVRDL